VDDWQGGERTEKYEIKLTVAYFNETLIILAWRK
jgi:hypothetical protein